MADIDTGGESGRQRLADFLRRRRDAILAGWTLDVARLPNAAGLSVPVLRDDIPELLDRMADFADSLPNGHVRVEELPIRSAQVHAWSRLRVGFEIEEVAVEYSLLRLRILHLLEEEDVRLRRGEVELLNQAIDHAVAIATRSYAHARQKVLLSLDRMSQIALDGESGTERLLQGFMAILLEAAAIDSVRIFVREGNLLRLRASAGDGEARPGEDTFALGDGFVGKIAETREVMLLHDAGVAARRVAPSGTLALKGVPVIFGDEVLGVAVMGSRSSSDFSADDKVLFRSMASRLALLLVHQRHTRERERAAERAQFFAEAGKLLSSSLDYRRVARELARLGGARLGHWGSVDLVDSRGEIETFIAHSDPSRAEVAETLRRKITLKPEDPIQQVLSSGKPQFLPVVSAEVRSSLAFDEAHLGLIRHLQFTSLLMVPLIARDKTLGVLTLLMSAESGRQLGPADLQSATQLASRAALAIDNARLYEEAQNAIRVRENLLAIVSHDLRNPLGAISMSAALLARITSTDGRLTRVTETIQRSSSRMEHLIRDLLDMASIQAGRLSVEPKDQEVSPILSEAFTLQLPLAREKGLSFTQYLEVEGVWVRCDRDRLLQVLSNLLGNAIKFCRPGESLELAARVEGEEVLFQVSDRGPGIAPDQLPHLFEPYWSAPQHARRGTGLGLYISKGIIDAQGGRIWAESTVGVGTTFYFTLPQSRPAPHASGQPPVDG